MISCIEWVPKGIADPTPKKYEFGPTELELIERRDEFESALLEEEQNNNDDDDDNSDEDNNNNNSNKLPEIDPKSLPPELRMDEYSDDEGDVSRGMALGKILVGNDNEILGDHPDNDDDDGVDSEDEGSSDEDHEMEEEMNDVNNKSDKDAQKDDVKEVDKREYMPVDVAGLEAMGISHEGGGDEYDDEDDDEDSDADDINLSPDDAIVVVAKTEDDFAVLEVHVYEEKSGNLFVHHDIPLPSFPLCLAHGDINHMGGAGNYIAVGTFSPGIEVWNRRLECSGTVLYIRRRRHDGCRRTYENEYDDALGRLAQKAAATTTTTKYCRFKRRKSHGRRYVVVLEQDPSTSHCQRFG